MDKCNQCAEFPCGKISSMLEHSKEYQKRCKEDCSDAEYEMMERAFFDKENNLRKYGRGRTDGTFSSRYIEINNYAGFV